MGQKNDNDSQLAKSQVDRFRERMRFVLLAIGLISLYGTGFLNVVFHSSRFHGNFGFLTTMKALFTCASSLIIFPIFFCIIAGIAAFIIHKTWTESLREDKLGRSFLHSKDMNPYGEACFLDPWQYSDAAQIRPAELCKGKILGQLDDEGKQCVDFNPYTGRMNSHMMVIGRSGAGKTFTFVKTFMLQAAKSKRSLFLADPKGDLYRETSGYFRDNGYVVRKLDLKTLEKSDGWHCLASLKGPNMITNTQIFSSTVMANISEHDDVYSRAGGSLLSALILRVLEGDDYAPEDKNIRTVHELLQNPGGIEFLDSLLDGTNNTSSESSCTSFYMDFKRASGNLSGNIITHLATGIQLFNNPLLSDILSTDDIDLALAGQQPCIYYLNFPDTNDTYRFVVSLFFSMAFIALVDYADTHTPNGKLPVPVDFLLDEFPALGIVPDWDRKIATVRSRGINCVMIIQDIPQLKMRYLESWMTIINNCGCVLTLGVNEPQETAPWISDRIGQTSIEVNTTAETTVAGSTKSFIARESTGVGQRALLSPAEICEISQDGSIILFSEKMPIYVNKFPYVLHPEAKKLYDTQPADVIDFMDKPARKMYRDAEKAYQEMFWDTHEEFPDMKLSDLSDALFLDPPTSPVSMTLDMIKDDMANVAKIFKKKVKDMKDEKNAEAGSNSDVEDGSSDDEIQKLMTSADAHAFDTFFENYKMMHQYDNLSETSIQVDETTGEIIGDVALTSEDRNNTEAGSEKKDNQKKEQKKAQQPPVANTKDESPKEQKKPRQESTFKAEKPKKAPNKEVKDVSESRISSGKSILPFSKKEVE